MSGNPTRTAELYVGLTRVTLKAGRCALNASYNEFDCDWFIQTKVKYNYNRVCTLTVSNQIIWFSIEFFTFQVTLKMKKVLGLTFYMTKPDMTLRTFPLYTSTLHTYCLFLHGTEALLGICSRYPEGDNSSFSSIVWLVTHHTKSKYRTQVYLFLGGYQRRTHGWSSAYRGN